MRTRSPTNSMSWSSAPPRKEPTTATRRRLVPWLGCPDAATGVPASHSAGSTAELLLAEAVPVTPQPAAADAHQAIGAAARTQSARTPSCGPVTHGRPAADRAVPANRPRPRAGAVTRLSRWEREAGRLIALAATPAVGEAAVAIGIIASGRGVSPLQAPASMEGEQDAGELREKGQPGGGTAPANRLRWSSKAPGVHQGEVLSNATLPEGFQPTSMEQAFSGRGHQPHCSEFGQLD